MKFSLQDAQFVLVLAVPIFLLIQLFERLLLFTQVVSPAYLVLLPALFSILALHKLSTAKGIRLPEAGQVAFALLCAALIVILMLQRLLLPERFDIFGRSSVGFSAYVGTYALTWGLIGLFVGNVNVQSGDSRFF